MAALRDLIDSARASPHADEPVGRLHTEGDFIHLVFDRTTGEYLAPTYQGIVEWMVATQKRRREAMKFAQDPERAARMAFLPYPEVAIPFRSFRSTRVAILDSGVLRDHPLLAAKIDEVHDLTGEGEEDAIGHGTIEAIRQIWHDDQARLVILKVFRRDATTTVSILAHSFALLRELDVGFIFMAGGVDVTKHPDAERVCAMASALVAEKMLAYGGFVSTRGNVGRAGRWCPAEADGVVGIAVADSDTFDNRLGTTGGLTVTQKGDYASFPDIVPLRLSDFYLQSARALRAQGEHDLAETFARRAVEAGTEPRVRAAAHQLLGGISYDRGAYPEAEAAFRAAADADPEYDVSNDLAMALSAIGRPEEAEAMFGRACALHPDDATVHLNHAWCLENVRKDRARAIEPTRRAAEISERSRPLLELGARAFYAREYATAIAANEAMMEVDPTFAAAAYNIAISHALNGDADAAAAWLDVYTSRRSDTGLLRFDRAAVAQMLQSSDELERRIRLRYALDPARQRTRHLAPLIGLITDTGVPWLPRRGVPGVPRRLASALRVLAERVNAFSEAASWLVPRLLLLPPADLHYQTAVVLVALAAGLPAADAAEALVAAGQLLVHRQDLRPAIATFDRALALLSTISARRVEEVLVEKGFAQIALGDLPGAEQSFNGVLSTSIYLNPENSEVLQTALTPRVYCGFAAVALHQGRAGDAIEHLRKAAAGGMSDAEVLLFHAAAAAAMGNPQQALAAFQQAARETASSQVRRRQVLHLIRRHSVLDRTQLEGMSMHDLMHAFHDYANQHDVMLCETRPSVRRPLPNLQSNTPVVTALLGTGIELDDQIAGRVVESVDFTGEGPYDRHGATTEQARGMIESGAASRILNVKILGSDGTGSRDALMRGLLWAANRQANLIVVNAFTDHDDSHLAGIASSVADVSFLLAAPPPAGHGNAFPLSVSSKGMLAPAFV